MQLQEEGFARADYLGRGRYDVTPTRTVVDGRVSYFPSREMPVFTIRPRHDGAIIVIGSRPDANAPRQLAGTDAEIDGRLIVTLDSGIEATSHNAQSRPPSLDLLFRLEGEIAQKTREEPCLREAS